MFKNNSENHYDIYYSIKMKMIWGAFALLCSCSNSINELDCNGIWESSDCGRFILMEDSTFICENLCSSILVNKFIPLNNGGTWKMRNYNGNEISLSFYCKNSHGGASTTVKFDIIKFITGENPYYFDFVVEDEQSFMFYKK